MFTIASAFDAGERLTNRNGRRSSAATTQTTCQATPSAKRVAPCRPPTGGARACDAKYRSAIPGVTEDRLPYGAAIVSTGAFSQPSVRRITRMDLLRLQIQQRTVANFDFMSSPGTFNAGTYSVVVANAPTPRTVCGAIVSLARGPLQASDFEYKVRVYSIQDLANPNARTLINKITVRKVALDEAALSSFIFSAADGTLLENQNYSPIIVGNGANATGYSVEVDAPTGWTVRVKEHFYADDESQNLLSAHTA
jgi:hypothetical protein